VAPARAPAGRRGARRQEAVTLARCAPARCPPVVKHGWTASNRNSGIRPSSKAPLEALAPPVSCAYCCTARSRFNPKLHAPCLTYRRSASAARS
jgi:hypothetical protein